MLSIARDFLKLNKIYFETVAALALTIASVFISILQYKLSSRQIILSDLQTKLAEAQALPVFEAYIQQKQDKTTGNYSENAIIVKNSGGPVYEFDADLAYFIDIEAVEKKPPSKHVRLRIPVTGYYFGTGLSAVTKGTLLSSSGFQNNQKIINLKKNIQIQYEKEGCAVLVTEESYVRMRYKDILNRSHLDFYYIQTVGQAEKMNDESGRAVFSEWREYKSRRDLADLTSKSIFEALAKLALAG